MFTVPAVHSAQTYSLFSSLFFSPFWFYSGSHLNFCRRHRTLNNCQHDRDKGRNHDKHPFPARYITKWPEECDRRKREEGSSIILFQLLIHEEYNGCFPSSLQACLWLYSKTHPIPSWILWKEGYFDTLLRILWYDQIVITTETKTVNCTIIITGCERATESDAVTLFVIKWHFKGGVCLPGI